MVFGQQDLDCEVLDKKPRNRLWLWNWNSAVRRQTYLWRDRIFRIMGEWVTKKGWENPDNTPPYRRTRPTPTRKALEDPLPSWE